MLEIQNVSKTFNAGTVNEKTALNGLNLKLNRRVGMELIQEELKKIPRDKVREIAAEHIKDICSSNRRDFRF